MEKKNYDNQDRYWAYFDEAWKKIIERFFPQLLCFFIPDLYEDADLSRGVDFLDKEMEQLSIISVKGAKYVDKLAKVYLKNGNEQWILVHIEVQGQQDKEFSLRMFRYFYRIFDRYGKKIVSMSILTGSEKDTGEGKCELKSYGSGVEFKYLSFRLMDYDKEKLSQDFNPIAMVVLASQEKEKAKQKGKRFNTKLYLIRKLYDKGYGKDEIRGLFDFIDWVLQLSDEEEKLIWDEVKELEEVKKMPYVLSIERISRAEGLQQGLQEGLQQGLQQGLLEDGRMMIVEALDERFGKIPSTISNAVNQIKDRDVLRFLLRQVIRCSSMEEFKQVLNRQN
ncbi:MAG: Rpn family recombination-promoting nuclease/putative transposase [Candidatus Desantisbacteria bacterium]